MNSLPYTGERMVPEGADDNTFWEHIYRYKFASRQVRGKRVLDIACGEGYGTAALGAAGASSVVGVDISADAVEHARSRYGVDARVGDAATIPLSNASVDVVVSFETIEHVTDPRRFLGECRRVLAPGGKIVISTPNSAIYGDRENPFHCSEMSISEFRSSLTEFFNTATFFAQRPVYSPWWDVRWPAAIDSPLYHVRGARRVVRLARRIVCPNLSPVGTKQSRMSPVAAILSSDRPFSSLFNPYAPQKSSEAALVRAEYVIAVAGARP